MKTKTSMNALGAAITALGFLLQGSIAPAVAWDEVGLPEKRGKEHYRDIVTKNPFGPLYVEEVRQEEEGPRIDVFKDVSLAGVINRGGKMTVKLFDFKKGKSYDHAIGVKNEDTGITIVSVVENDVWTKTEVKASDGRVTEDLGYKTDFLKRRKPAGAAPKAAAKGKTSTGRTSSSGRTSTSQYDPRNRSSSATRTPSSGYNRTSSSSRPRVMLPSRSRTGTQTNQPSNQPTTRTDPNVQQMIDQAKKK